jgi:hypothetical protein
VRVRPVNLARVVTDRHTPTSDRALLGIATLKEAPMSSHWRALPASKEAGKNAENATCGPCTKVSQV